METKGFFQFKINPNVLVSSFWFIWIPMLWVYDRLKYIYSYSVGIDFKRQNLTSTDVRFWRLSEYLHCKSYRSFERWIHRNKLRGR